jgi:hypothetical protein
MKRIACLLFAGILLCLSLAGCGNDSAPATAGVQTHTAFTVAADDFMTQFIGLTMREPIFVSDKDSTVNQGGKIKTYSFDDNMYSNIRYTLSLDYQPADGLLSGVTLSSQLLEKADKSGHDPNPFFGLYAREAIRALAPDADLSAINDNCNFSGTSDADTSYQTSNLSIRTVIVNNTITMQVTAL